MMGGGGEGRYNYQRTANVRRTRPQTMETRLQVPVDLRLLARQTSRALERSLIHVLEQTDDEKRECSKSLGHILTLIFQTINDTINTSVIF